MRVKSIRFYLDSISDFVDSYGINTDWEFSNDSAEIPISRCDSPTRWEHRTDNDNENATSKTIITSPIEIRCRVFHGCMEAASDLNKALAEGFEDTLFPPGPVSLPLLNTD